jgi:hypothetical protein
VGALGAKPRGGANGAERGGRGSAMWTGMAQTRWLWAAPTVAGGARLTGALRTGEDGGARATWARPADRWERAVAGPGGQRPGAGETRESGQHGGSR